MKLEIEIVRELIQEFSQKEVGKRLGCSQSTIRRFMRDNDIISPRKGNYKHGGLVKIKKACRNCGEVKLLEAKRKFCSRSCYEEFEKRFAYRKRKPLSDSEVIYAIRNSKTMGEAARSLNTTRTRLKSVAKRLGMWAPNPSGRGTFKSKINLTAVLTGELDYKANRQLRKRLVREGYKEDRCERCGTSDWMGQELSLHLHHKDGNKRNNKLSNLEILCPNCHSQTKTYCRSKSVKRRLTNQDQVVKLANASG